MVLPTITFTIPSLQDQTELECRVYRPDDALGGNSLNENDARGAILAHPYASLGGCFDDPAILAATEELLRKGYVVGTFNFRGAGASKGSTSWTGLPELADYVSFVGFFVRFLAELRGPALEISLGTKPDAIHTLAGEHAASEVDPMSITLILGGYSYGSRIMTYLPSVSSIVDRFSRTEPNSCESMIQTVALQLAANERNSINAGVSMIEGTRNSQRRRQHSVHVGGSDEKGLSNSNEPSTLPRTSPKQLSVAFKQSFEAIRPRRKSRAGSLGQSNASATVDDPNAPNIITNSSNNVPSSSTSLNLKYLIISPVLPPAGWLTSPRLERPSPTSDESGPASMKVAGKDMQVVDNWWDYPSLILYGDNDQFTSSKKIQQWVEGLSPYESPNPIVKQVKVDQQDHFWHGRESERYLRKAIRDWLENFPKEKL